MWKCRACTFENDSKTSTCSVCLSKKHLDESTSPNGWLCRACTYQNSNISDSCEMCGTSRDPKKPPRPPPPCVASTSSRPSTSPVIELMNEQVSALKFTEIITECKRFRRHYLDESFKPGPQSIGQLPPEKHRDLQSLVWLRPAQIHTDEGKQYRWTLFREPVLPTDIQQGTLGNCWFMSALSVVSERPEILRKIALTQDYCHEGVYEIRLNINGMWGVILVDDCFPCFASSRAMAFSRGRRNQLWVPLIEKALAKVFGSYAALTSGLAIEGLTVLTGAPCESERINPPDKPWDANMAWAKFLSGKEAGFLMGCSCGRGDDIDEEVYRYAGLQSHHCYSILNVQEIDGHRLIQLRNPWGRFSWKGDWSDSSNLWTPALKSFLMPSGPTAGVFWISFQDFCNYFERVDICKLHRDWHEARVALSFPANFSKEGFEVPYLTVTESVEVELTIYQESFRQSDFTRLHDKLDLCMIVMKESTVSGKLEFIAACNRKIKATRNLSFFAQPGNYLIVPVVLKHWWASGPMENRIPPRGAVAAFSSRKVELTKKTVPATVLSDSLTQMTLSMGTQLYFSNSANSICNCYYLSAEDFAGLLMVIENTNRVFASQIRVQCFGSQNVVSTRGTLHTLDTVPPRHRQIVNILTQLEGSESFSVSYSVECSEVASMSGLLSMIGISRGTADSNASHIPEITDSVMAIHSVMPIPN